MSSKIDLLDRLQNQVDQNDPPPGQEPDDEEVGAEEPTEEVHVAYLHLEDFGCLGAPQVSAEHHIHERDQGSNPQVDN